MCEGALTFIWWTFVRCTFIQWTFITEIYIYFFFGRNSVVRKGVTPENSNPSADLGKLAILCQKRDIGHYDLNLTNAEKNMHGDTPAAEIEMW